MKKLLILFVFLFSLHSTTAQENTSTEVKWLTNFNDAQKIAQKEHKPLLLLFTGSDWCPPCKAMHRDLFHRKKFIELAKKFVLVYVDFPKRHQLDQKQREHNYQLAMKYHRGGVPTMVFVKPDGKIISKISGYMFGKPERNLEAMKKVLLDFKS